MTSPRSAQGQARARLGILTVLAQTETATFGYLKSVLELTAGNLGRHLETLATEHLAALNRLVDEFQSSAHPTGQSRRSP